jgi:hypothetical protein
MFMLVWSCSLANSPSALEPGSILHQQVQVVFYSLFGVISDEIWGMIKTTAPYQLPQYKILELVVESEKKYPDLTTMIRPVFLKVVIQS